MSGEGGLGQVTNEERIQQSIQNLETIEGDGWGRKLDQGS